MTIPLYKQMIYHQLNKYAAAQTAVVTIPEQIQVERLRRETLKAQRTDGDHVSGGDTTPEEATVSSLTMEHYLECKLEECRATLAVMDGVMAQLTADEREIVRRLIMAREQNGVRELADKWYVDERTVYRWKDNVVVKLAQLLYGGAEV